MVSICAQARAAAHIGQGSIVTYIVQPFKYFPPNHEEAEVKAIISACALTSLSFSVWLYPREIFFSPPTTMPARMVISSFSSERPACFSAFFIKSSKKKGPPIHYNEN